MDKLFLRQGFDKTMLKFTENGPKTILLEGHDTLPVLPNGCFLYLTKATISLSSISEFLIYKLWIHTHFSQALFLDWGKWNTHLLTSTVSILAYYGEHKMHLWIMQARCFIEPYSAQHLISVVRRDLVVKTDRQDSDLSAQGIGTDNSSFPDLLFHVALGGAVRARAGRLVRAAGDSCQFKGITSYYKPENVGALSDAVEKYGSYPIKID